MDTPLPQLAMHSRTQLCATLHASEQGLTQAEAEQRLHETGPNELALHQSGQLLAPLRAFIANPLVLILLLASLVSGLLHDMVNAVIIALMVLLSGALNVV